MDFRRVLLACLLALRGGVMSSQTGCGVWPGLCSAGSVTVAEGYTVWVTCWSSTSVSTSRSLSSVLASLGW